MKKILVSLLILVDMLVSNPFIATAFIDDGIYDDTAMLNILYYLLGLFIFLTLTITIPMWIIFEKAGKPGWAAIVPIYNLVVLLEIIGLPMWWLAIVIMGPAIPFINAFVGFIYLYFFYLLARSFGKNEGFSAGMVLALFIFLPILAFDGSQYIGPAAAKAPAPLPGTPPMPGQPTPPAPGQVPPTQNDTINLQDQNPFDLQ